MYNYHISLLTYTLESLQDKTPGLNHSNNKDNKDNKDTSNNNSNNHNSNNLNNK